VHPTPPTPEHLQRAVDDANRAIRGFLRQVPGGRLSTPGQRVVYELLVSVYNAAVAELHAAREGEDEPAAGLVLTA
jgi:hypothetical protein